MTHNEKRGSASREAALALFTGGIYGASHTISGHPLDTIKSKMQISGGEFKNADAWTTARMIMQKDGLVGFFRGVVPPLWGSVVYRGIMMSSYEYGFTYLSKNLDENHWLKQEVFLGLRPMVLTATVFSSLCRCGLENPIEYAKVMGQTGKKWIIKDIYRGVGWQVVRTTGLLLPIFGGIDVARRYTNWMNSFWGQFGVTAGSAAGAYFVCWPLETLKNLTQSGTPRAGASLKEKIEFMGGIKGLWRGVGPGTICGGFRNGVAMLCMVNGQKWATQLGLRD